MRFLTLLLVLLALSLGAYAQDTPGGNRESEIEQASRDLRQLATDIESATLSEARTSEAEIRAIMAESRSRLGPVNAALQKAVENLSLLGPAPKEGEPAEAPAIASEREELNTRIATLRGQRLRILANIDEANALLGRISKRRLKGFYLELGVRGEPLFSHALWRGVGSDAADLAGDFDSYFSRWSAEKREGRGVPLNLAALLAAFGVSLLIFGPIHRWMRRIITMRIEAREPTPGRRVAVAGVKMLARLIPGIIGGLIIIETARAVGLLQSDGLAVARAIWIGLIAFLLVQGFTSGLFAPAAPSWRIADLEAAKARRASALLLGIVIVFGAKEVLIAIAEAAGGLEDLSHWLAAVSSLTVGTLLILLCRRRLWISEAKSDGAAEERASPDEATAAGGVWPVLRLAGRILGAGVIAAAIAGFASLADFAASRLYYLSLLFSVAWFVRAALKELTSWTDRRLKAERDREGAEDEDKQAFVFWVGAGIDLALLLLLAPILLVFAGVDLASVRDLLLRAFVGFRVGGVIVSLSDVFAAIFAFVLILVATRLLQSALQRGPLAHSRIDAGIQNSLVTLFGYVGLVIAVIVGVSVLGFNLSNLALIAGALSVGIGFGLQSIVNNFVSGLILLFERPIKAGDWIVTASGEGIVKKISVRSTEIETFDRSSIIIPNSELISSTVTNWTHKDRLGRIRVAVGVAYHSDPEKVREILLRCANDHPLIVRYPEPFVVWQEFGASSLDFEIRAYLRDIAKGLQVKTDLRFQIFKAFKEEGVEIPFPQQDIYVKSLPGRESLAKTDAARAEAGKPVSDPPPEPEFASDD